ncbi:dioxygenase, partial [Acinetobacter junii]|uniref:dioxygenase n=1 Tax=Acinetobacter junii TaxID=40215 RepID=UPI0023570E34
LGDLFQAIEDLDIQASEVWKGLEYFTDAGQANELGLLAAGLGERYNHQPYNEQPSTQDIQRLNQNIHFRRAFALRDINAPA